MEGDQPIIPDYLDANVRAIVPALLGPGEWSQSLPAWIPDPVHQADQAVLLVIDGLGWDQFEAHRAHMPVLSTLTGSAISTVAPTTTATALCSIATGLTPGEHGLVGYRIVVHGEVLNVLRWVAGESDRRRALPPGQIQPFTPFLGFPVPVVSPAELESTAFTEAHLRGSRPVGYRAPSSIAVEIRRQLARGERFVYAYYGSVDKIAHERGFGEFYEAELAAADRLVADVLDVPAARGDPPRHRRPRASRSRRASHRPRPGHPGDGGPAVRGRALPMVARREGVGRRAGQGSHRRLR